MDFVSADTLSQHPTKASDPEHPAAAVSEQNNSSHESSSMESKSGTTSLASIMNPVQPVVPPPETSDTGKAGRLTFARLASGIGFNFAQKVPGSNESTKATSFTAQSGVLESLTKGLVDSSLSAVKAVQVKARHMVSQNKRRYQEGGFDLDMTYITENILAMGFPAGDLSSGFFGYVEGLYRNHMEEVIKFFEIHHKDKYKVYNLCSERLYDASLFEGKVASFPFDDHNCPPIHLIPLFCQSAYSWLKQDILNVVVVHCKAGKARTGLMICTLLLFLKFFPTAEECIDYYNQKRCVDGKGLILPSQIRYVKYYERILANFNGENPPGRRCMLRGFRLHKCPSWLRPSITISNHNGILFSTRKHPKTKDLMPEDFWIRAPRKGIVVFALPGEPGLTELMGDFKIHFHDRQGDFYCWLNTTMMENRLVLNTSDLDDFDRRKFPSPGFQVEIVMIDFDGTVPAKYHTDNTSVGPNGSLNYATASADKATSNSDQTKVPDNQDNDNVFSDSDEEEIESSRRRLSNAASGSASAESGKPAEQIVSAKNVTEQLSVASTKPTEKDERSSLIPNLDSGDIKAMAADASVFTFGDEDDFDSD